MKVVYLNTANRYTLSAAEFAHKLGCPGERVLWVVRATTTAASSGPGRRKRCELFAWSYAGQGFLAKAFAGRILPDALEDKATIRPNPSRRDLHEHKERGRRAKRVLRVSSGSSGRGVAAPGVAATAAGVPVGTADSIGDRAKQGAPDAGSSWRHNAGSKLPAL